MTLASFEEFTESFADLIHKVEGFDARVPEDSALIGLASDIVPEVTRRLRDGIELLREVEAFYDPAKSNISKPDGEDTLFFIGKLISTELASRDLFDVAFLARNELSAALDRLETSALLRTDGVALASHCESGLRCLRKALVSVESAVYEYEERKAPERHWVDIELSLQIRKLYWNLRNETEYAAHEDEDDIESRLRRVLYRIMAFRELSIYPFLRVDDRVHLRDLLKRILEWLNSDEREQKIAEQLWADLSSFTELLVQVSRRQELQDFDRELIGRIHEQLFDRIDEPAQGMTPIQLAELEKVLGLDEELDDLICNRIAYVEAWRQTLERLMGELDRPGRAALKVELLTDDDFG